MLEVLLSIVIISLSLLGLAGLQARAHNSEFESYQREQALMFAYSMVESVRATRADAANYRTITNSASGLPYLGTPNGGGDSNIYNCGAVANTRVSTVLCAWNATLSGAGESKTTSGVTTNIGGIIAARGCILYDAATEMAPGDGTGRYSVVVTWQGSLATGAPLNANSTPINCANNTYSSESNRRAVAVTFTLPKL